MRPRIAALAPLLSALITAGCRMDAGFDDHPDRFEIDGPGVIYATASAWPRWNGNVVELGLFDEAERNDEFLSFDLWPLVGVGVGFVGARVRVLMFEVGAATLCYDPLPLPSRYGWNAPATPPAVESDEKTPHEGHVRAD